MQDLRPIITIGTIEVSVQASSFHYCSPKLDNLPIEAYESVEVAIWAPCRESEDGKRLTHPSRVGVGGYDHFFEDGRSPVAGYVPIEVVGALLDQLQASQQD